MWDDDDDADEGDEEEAGPDDQAELRSLPWEDTVENLLWQAEQHGLAIGLYCNPLGEYFCGHAPRRPTPVAGYRRGRLTLSSEALMQITLATRQVALQRLHEGWLVWDATTYFGGHDVSNGRRDLTL